MTFAIAIIALWILFYSYWLISAIGVKKAVRGTPWLSGAGIRLLLVLSALMLIRLFRHHNVFFRRPSSIAVNLVGTSLCVAGLGFAVWARLHLGRNWGVPMSL